MVNDYQLSERHACTLVGLSRDSYRHPIVASTLNQELLGKIVQTAHERRRWGYRMIHDALRPQYPNVNHKRIYRLYRQEGLAIRKRKKTKRVGARLPLVAASAINQTWSMDFVSDAIARPGAIARRIKCLTVADDFNQTVLQHLSPHGLTLDDLPFQGVRYNMAKAYADKAIIDRRVGFNVSFRGLPLDRPQLFLNEARQSAVALSLYLGARLACAPQTTPHLKMLILDDVLIGLDHSNRLPVLGVLESKFAEWQTVLLTHDRGWFDLARERLKTGWVCCEIYEGDIAATAPMPIAGNTENRPGKALLAKGRELLALNYVEAAANYTRQAFEFGLRGACEFQKVKLNYKLDSKDHKAQDLLDALKGAPKPNAVSQTDWTSCLRQIEMFKNVVMNPYSHPSSPNIPRQEVVDAANAVERFLELAGKK